MEKTQALETSKGFLDGNGFTISGLSIDKNEDQIGLFSALNGAVVQNLNIIAEEIKGDEAVGGLAGSAENSYIYNCSVAGDVYSDAKHAGLLLGKSVNSQILSLSYKRIFVRK